MKNEINALKEENRKIIHNEGAPAEERLEILKSEYLRKHF